MGVPGGSWLLSWQKHPGPPFVIERSTSEDVSYRSLSAVLSWIWEEQEGQSKAVAIKRGQTVVIKLDQGQEITRRLRPLSSEGPVELDTGHHAVEWRLPVGINGKKWVVTRLPSRANPSSHIKRERSGRMQSGLVYSIRVERSTGSNAPQSERTLTSAEKNVLS